MSLFYRKPQAVNGTEMESRKGICPIIGGDVNKNEFCPNPNKTCDNCPLKKSESEKLKTLSNRWKRKPWLFAADYLQGRSILNTPVFRELANEVYGSRGKIIQELTL